MNSSRGFPVKKKILLIFAKQPRSGATKTRLCPPLTLTDAARIYAAMVEDLLTLAKEVTECQQWLCYDPIPTAASYFRAISPDLHTMPQSGSSLGARMVNAFATSFAEGATSAVIIGTDSPDLPLEYINQAFALLETAATDVVFGPTMDGGYYLVGARQVWPELFTAIPWSTPAVLTTSLDKAATAGIRTCLLPEWYDIDTVDDLRRLAESPGNTAPLTRLAAAGLLTSCR